MGNSYRNCKYSIHDFVHFKDDFIRIYRIVGYRYQFDFTHEGETVEIFYELLRDIDKRIIVAKEEELEKITSSSKLFSNSYKFVEQRKKKERPNYKEYMNNLLDAYNDYQLLYRMFHDEAYLVKANQVKKDYLYILEELH